MGHDAQPLQLVPINLEKQGLHLEAFSDCHTMTESKPSNPAEELHFRRLFSPPYSLGQYTQLVRID